ncbi:alpha-galactosidase [Marinomonas epiphytica]
MTQNTSVVFYRQDKNLKTLLLACSGNCAPQLIYYGDSLPLDTDLSCLYESLALPIPQAMLDKPAPLSLLPEAGRGWMQAPAVEASSDERPVWGLSFELVKGEETDTGFEFSLTDLVAEVEVKLHIGLRDSGVLSQQIHVKNLANTKVMVQRLACTMPFTDHCTQLMSFYGRWCQEFQQQRCDWQSTWLQENRNGRNSHANFPSVIVGQQGFTESMGEVFGAHLAWSGNHRLKADYTIEGYRYLQAEALYLPGEIQLEPDQILVSPELLVSHSSAGLNLMSQGFHAEARARLQINKPRPVHLNTWEAFYFDHDLDELKKLAQAGHEVGVERYILDDGWFKGRNDDTRALGDWYVDSKKYPDGLMPLIDYVKSLGMEFGLWFEPEMLNPDSDLYRRHPEWALQLKDYDSVLARHQLVLNLAHEGAYQYIKERLFTLFSDYPIDYVKWDMNRDYVLPSGQIAPQAHAQVLALYRLLGEINHAFPKMEIESCSSGGARVDFGILNYTKRFWTSDCNDALERQTIQQGFSYFFPPEVMGAHIGPVKSHTTSRVHGDEFRAGTAMLGHLGIEWNLLEADREQKALIKRWLGHYKTYRCILHNGLNWQINSADGCARAQWAVSAEMNEGVLVYSQQTMPRQAQPLKVRLQGLDENTNYQVHLVDHSILPGHLMKSLPAWWHKPRILNGASLQKIGLVMPIMDPESLILLSIKAVP